MKDFLNEIDSRFPIRNSGPQKDAFRDYVAGEADTLGYSVRVETQGAASSGAHRNIVIGNPEEAAVVFTAHYDTPRRALIPNLMLPLNPVLKWTYVLLPIVAMLAVAIGCGYAARLLSGLQGRSGRLVHIGVYLAVYFGLFLLLFRGPANRRNRNDNTSGTAAVLSLAERLSGDSRAAFILFDNEEKGKKGSRAYAGYRPELKRSRLVVNMDCVGNGSQFIVGAAEAAMKDPLFPSLSSALEEIGAKVFPAREANMNSDHKNFDRGVGICACLYRKGIGYYTPRIHTGRDNVASPENIDRLTGALAAFVRQAEPK